MADKFLPKAISRRRRKGQASNEADTSHNGAGVSANDEALARGRSQDAATDTPDSSLGSSSINSRSLTMADDADESFVSYESDPELSQTSRPSAISSHPSQIGYLTTSNPLVLEEHHAESLSPELASSDPSPHTSTVAVANAGDPELPASQTTLVATGSQERRTPSPAGRFRDVFRKKTSVNNLNSAAGDAETASPSQASNGSNATETTVAATSQRLRGFSRSKADSQAPPQTPPSADKAAPVIVNTPPTPTLPEHQISKGTAASASPSTPGSQANASPAGSMNSQRRSRGYSSGLGPSKLSNITAAPLTPTAESGPLTPGNTATGFFSSMISAVQNTANTLTNTINNTNLGQGGSKNKLPLQQHESDEKEQGSQADILPSKETATEHSVESTVPAVKTLGQGDLSLSQLGIMEPSSTGVTPVTARFPDLNETRGRAESAPIDVSQTSGETLTNDLPSLNRPQSLYDTPVGGERTTPQGSIYEEKTGPQRSGSIRSAISRRRKRGSSAATGGTGGTGTTIGAAIAAANASVAHPNAQSSVHKLTGFAVASKKRNRDFHTLFKSVPDNDYLIEDYSCALQREILAHGRLYVSEGHLCFSSNIFGWITTLVMSFDEIVSVEKRSTALLFKNGLEISTLHAKHIFASFTSRDSTYDLIIKIWKLGHPSLKSSLNGVRLDETGGDRTERIDTESVADSRSASGSGDESDEDDEVYDEDEEGEDGREATQLPEVPATLDVPAEKTVTRKPSGAVTTNGNAEKESEGAAVPSTGADFPGPATHAPTDCGDLATHYDKVIGDDVIPAPLGKVYNLMFGPGSAAWMGKWLTGDQKCTDLQMEDKKGLTEDNKTRNYSYIKPLNASIGPRQTKCIVSEQLETLNLDKSVNVHITTQNPDVPSGNVFSVKTKYCLSWAENNATRIQANCTIEWTGKSWLKGPIEKGANDGQTQHCKDLFAALKAAVTSRARSNTLTNGKGKKKGRKGKSASTSGPTSDGEGPSKAKPQQDWGLLEPTRPFLGPVVDTLKPILTGNVVYGLLVGLLVASWFGFGSYAKTPRHYGHEMGYVSYPDRLAAYEEMWRREASELWEWLEERVGIDGIHNAGGAGGGFQLPRKKAVDPRTMAERVREERMSERELKEAIRVTEEKLKVLKSVVDKDAKAS